MKLSRIIPILLACGLVLVSTVSFLFPRTEPIDEGNAVFFSGVYRSYLSQIRHFLRQHPSYGAIAGSDSSPLNEQLRELDTLLESPLDSPEMQRAVHEQFVVLLRTLSASELSSTAKGAANSLVTDLIRFIYLQINLNAPIEDYLYSILAPPTGDLSSYLREAQAGLHKNPQYQGIKYEPDVDDCYAHGNLPSVYFQLSNPSGTKVIRMGKPFTVDQRFPWNSPELNQEFLHFVQTQPGHLYVNLLRTAGSGGRISIELRKLEGRNRDFYLIQLDKNSDFYLQEGKKFQGEIEPAAFKEMFFEQLTLKNGRYYWSHHLEGDAWRNELKEILDNVHAAYFPDSATLNPSQRQDFIEITYLEILEALVEKWNPPSLNLTCNQGIDRAPSLLVLWMLKRGQTTDRQAAALLLGPPLLVRNRPSHKARIDRFVSGWDRIQNAGKAALSPSRG